MSSHSLIDVSHMLEHGMITYKGLPAPMICDYLTREQSRAHYASGTEFHIGKIEMVANTGTYIDSPFHRYAEGKDLAALPLESLADLPCVVSRVPRGSRVINHLPLTEADVRGAAVLVHTRWDRHSGSDQYFDGHPHLTGELAKWLIGAGAVLVGIDSLNIDSTETGERPVHSKLLAHEIPIVEHLCGLGAVPERGGRFFAVPVKVKGVRHLSRARICARLALPADCSSATLWRHSAPESRIRILREGTERGRTVAHETLRDVRHAMHFDCY